VQIDEWWWFTIDSSTSTLRINLNEHLIECTERSL
jgi:hypothetical protein